MKKKIAVLLGMVLTVFALTGCTNKTPGDAAQTGNDAVFLQSVIGLIQQFF